VTKPKRSADQRDAYGTGKGFSDGGGASRFFYQAKVSRKERNLGCDDLPTEQQETTRDPDAPGGNNPRNRGAKRLTNNHPTAKPVALMRWLVRLVTPPGGLVLDPFTGSGSTGIAARLEGARFLGFEREASYVKIAKARISAALKLQEDDAAQEDTDTEPQHEDSAQETPDAEFSAERILEKSLLRNVQLALFGKE
jgi:site-specific DNA-methyltransferase (adenine-specific)